MGEIGKKENVMAKGKKQDPPESPEEPKQDPPEEAPSPKEARGEAKSFRGYVTGHDALAEMRARGIKV